MKRSLFGRRRELSALLDSLARLEQGRGGVSLLRGPAGIGKSALLLELAERARARGFAVLAANCARGDTGFPLLPFASGFRKYFAMLEPDEVSRLTSGIRGLPALLPETTYGVEQTIDPHQMSGFEAARQLFLRLAAKRPVVFVCDDLHWADTATQRLFAFLGRQLQGAPVLLLTGVRSEELSPELAEILSELCLRPPHAKVVEPRELTLGECRQVAQLALNTDEPPSLEFTAQLMAHTRGNPLFIRLLAPQLACGNGSERATELSHSAMAALRRLGPHVCSVLSLAAVIGEEFPVELVVAVSDEPRRTVLDSLRIARERGLVVELRDSPGSMQFGNAFMRDSALQLLLEHERADLHKRLIRLIPGLPVSAEARLRLLAYHFREAGQFREAADHAEAAGLAAHSRGALRSAGLLLEQALADLKRCGVEPPPRLLLAAARSWSGALRGEVAAALYSKAAERLSTAGDGEGALRARALAVRANPSARTVDALSEAIAQQSLCSPTPAFALALTTLLQTAVTSGTVGSLATYHDLMRAYRIAQQTGSEQAQAIALIGLGVMLANGRHYSQGMDLLERALATALPEHPREAFTATVNLINLRMKAGEWAEARLLAESEIELCKAWGAHHAVGLLLSRISEIERLSGSLEQALDLAAEALLWTDSEHPTALNGAVIVKVAALAALERWNEALEQLQTSNDGGVLQTALIRFYRALAAREAGEFPRAHRLLQEAWEAWNRTGDCYYGLPIALAWEDELLRSGANDEAQAALRKMERRSQRIGRGAVSQAAAAAVAEARGLLAQATGRTADAEQEFTRAAALWGGLARPDDEARAQRHRGRVHLLMGDRNAARDAFCRAGELWASVGSPLAQAVANEVRSHRLSPARRGGLGLSERELEIAHLVAEGLSSRAIAELLVISPRTVDNHVARVLAKLGLHSRAALGLYLDRELHEAS